MSRENKSPGSLQELLLSFGQDPQPLPERLDPYWKFHRDNDEMPIVFDGDDAFPLSEPA